LHVTGIAIDEPEVTLLRNPAGQWNYSSLGASSKSAASHPASKSPSSAPDVSVKKLELKNGKIIFGTTNSQKRNTYDQVTVTAGDVSMKLEISADRLRRTSRRRPVQARWQRSPVDKSDTSLYAARCENSRQLARPRAHWLPRS